MPWDKQAHNLLEAHIDPGLLFSWPFARVLVVFFGKSFSGERVMSPGDLLEWMNRKRQERGLEPLSEMPKTKPLLRDARHGRR